MTATIIPINGDKAVALIKDFVREWRMSCLLPQDILDEFGERAMREGIVSKQDMDTWDEASMHQNRERRLREKFANAFKPIPPWE